MCRRMEMATVRGWKKKEERSEECPVEYGYVTRFVLAPNRCVSLPNWCWHMAL